MVNMGSVFSSLWAVFSAMSCINKECYDDKSILPNFSDLSQTITSKVYGQHLVTETLLKHLKVHLQQSPRKALVLSFHGLTGTGKNYVSSLIAEKMFPKEMKKKCVNWIIPAAEFRHKEDAEKMPLYKDKLWGIIEIAVKECPRALIIIDEMEKMPHGLTDTIKPYLDFHEEVGGVDYRNATFFFLGNTAGHDILEKTMQYWIEGMPRESIKLEEMEKIIMLSALNNKSSGLWQSELIRDDLISAFIPFLPLERKHVKQCIKDSLIENKYFASKEDIPEAKVQEIADQFMYFPTDSKVFATAGCKRVDDKVHLIMADV